jgi:hypothetical protein
MGFRTLYMPDSLENTSKIKTVSGPPHTDLPVKLDTLTAEEEKFLISGLTRELN